jgi:hypothetical protein
MTLLQREDGFYYELTQPPSETILDRLRSEIAQLTSDALGQSAKYLSWARLWQAAYLVVGLSTAVLTAVAGATGLASTAGRIPAAVMALSAAALAAAARFLGSNERYEKNRRRSIAWQVLADEARLASAGEGHPGAQTLYRTMQDLLQRRAIIMEMYHTPLPPIIVRKLPERRNPTR